METFPTVLKVYAIHDNWDKNGEPDFTLIANNQAQLDSFVRQYGNTKYFLSNYKSIKDFKGELLTILFNAYPSWVNIRSLIREYASEKPDDISYNTREQIMDILSDLSTDAKWIKVIGNKHQIMINSRFNQSINQREYDAVDIVVKLTHNGEREYKESQRTERFPLIYPIANATENNKPSIIKKYIKPSLIWIVKNIWYIVIGVIIVIIAAWLQNKYHLPK